jgi:hypothetical protein
MQIRRETEEEKLVDLKDSHEDDERYPLARYERKVAAESEASEKHRERAQEVERISPCAKKDSFSEHH